MKRRSCRITGRSRWRGRRTAPIPVSDEIEQITVAVGGKLLTAEAEADAERGRGRGRGFRTAESGRRRADGGERTAESGDGDGDGEEGCPLPGGRGSPFAPIAHWNAPAPGRASVFESRLTFRALGHVPCAVSARTGESRRRRALGPWGKKKENVCSLRITLSRSIWSGALRSVVATIKARSRELSDQIGREPRPAWS